MTNEPGERRRRREAERARQLAAAEQTAQGLASDGAAGADDAAGDGARPVTDRADGDAGAPAPGAVAAGPSGRPAVPATAAASAADPSRPMSRRELRELERRRAAEAGVDLPVDQPPAADRTGHGPHGRRAADAGGPATGPQPTAGLLPAQRTGPPRGAPPSPRPSADDAPSSPARLGADDRSPRPGPDAAPSTLPSGPGRPGRPAAPRPEPRSEPTTEPRPPAAWAPTSRAAATGAPAAVPRSDAPVSTSDDDVTSPGPQGADLEDHDDHDAPHERHRYTWVHLVVLLLVAFVLGFLIWSLVDAGDTQSGAAAASAVPTAVPTSVPTVSSGPPTTHRGEL